MLSTLIWLPVLGAALVGFWPRSLNPSRTHFAARAIAGLACVWTIVLIYRFDFQAGLQFQEHLTWIEPLGLDYQLGVDGLSLPLVVLNSLLVWLVIQSTEELARPRLFYALVLLLSAAVTGAFLAQNLLLFFLFYELELIPLYLLIAIWGGAQRGYAATKFLIYQALSGVILLVSFLGWAWLSGSATFAYGAPTQALSSGAQLLLLLTLLVGFGIKMPLVPFHTWLPDAYVEASAPISVLLGGIVSKLGTYGLLRFGLGLFPDAWTVVAPWLSVVTVVTALYGSLVAIAQTDMKKMVAYSSVTHLSYVLLASAAATPLSLLGAVYQMIAHGLIVALLFHLVGIIERKTGSRDLTALKGLLNPKRGLPLIGGLIVIGTMASAGIPGMVGFIGEFLSFQGSYTAFPVQTLLCLATTALTSVYFVILINRALFGRLEGQLAYLPKVGWSERVPAIVLTVLIIALGIQPNWLVRWSQATTDAMVAAMPVINHQQVAIPVLAAVPPTPFLDGGERELFLPSRIGHAKS